MKNKHNTTECQESQNVVHTLTSPALEPLGEAMPYLMYAKKAGSTGIDNPQRLGILCSFIFSFGVAV